MLNLDRAVHLMSSRLFVCQADLIPALLPPLLRSIDLGTFADKPLDVSPNTDAGLRWHSDISSCVGATE